jgi:type I restriction enzyme M protein
MMEYISLGGGQMPKVRNALITTLKAELLQHKVLDQFQIAGIFVNWWTNIKYDLKTIATIGWVPSLVPKQYFIDKYFSAEADAIIDAELKITEHETALQNAIEDADYQADDNDDDADADTEEKEEKNITTKMVKDYLAQQIKTSTKKDKDQFAEQLQAIKEAEDNIKDAKQLVKNLEYDLDKKVEYKMYGVDDAKAETQKLALQTKVQLMHLNSADAPTDKKELEKYNKQIKNLNADLTKMELKLADLDHFLHRIGGVITPAQCKTLILQKHNTLLQQELLKYLNAEKRTLIAGLEKLHTKYATPAQSLEATRQNTLDKLNAFLKELKYL